MTRTTISNGRRALLALGLALAMALGLAALGARPAHAALAQLDDGTYSVPVTLSGGSGRASVSSPATVEVAGGKATATIVWSSSNYDKMTVGKTDYAPTTIEGGSTFEIPLTDDEMKVRAETTAMGTPHTISYTLSFDMGSAQPAGEGSAAASDEGSGGGDAGGASGGSGFSPLLVGGSIVVLLAVGIVLGVVASRRKARR